MEFLVTMTTHVPDGTTDDAVDQVRGREAAHTRELAAQGHVLRLWRPPLAPGEWRTIGLFAAAGPAELEPVLASMPLRVWRSDTVQPLTPDRNDPAPGASAPVRPGEAAAEFLVRFTPAVREGTPPGAVGDAEAHEAERARELGRQGRLVRLWRLPADGGGVTPVLGLWRVAGQPELAAILASLPLRDHQTTQVTALTPHPSDPAAPGSRWSAPHDRPTGGS
jgi:muconolactone delta-isomerase